MTFDGPSRRILCEPLNLRSEPAPETGAGQDEPQREPAEPRPVLTVRRPSDG